MTAALELTDEQQDAVAIEVSNAAWHYARHLVPDDTHQDVAQNVVLDCLIALRGGTWKTPRRWLRAHVRLRVKKTWANMRRAEKHLGESQDLFAAEWGDGRHEGMLPILQFDADDLFAYVRETLEVLPESAVKTFLLVREMGYSYKEAAVERGITAGLVHKHVSLVTAYLRGMTNVLDIRRPYSHSGGRPFSRVTRNRRRRVRKAP